MIVLSSSRVPVKMWTDHVPVEEDVKAQLLNLVEVVHTLRQVVCVKG